MFGIDTSELVIVAVVALLFIGPKELPAAMRTVGRWIGKVRGMARHFNSGIEAVIREAELEEMDRKWREENERIMRQYPALDAPIVTAETSAGSGEVSPAIGEAAPAEPAEKRELP
jgi:sec-independent protein translocase protein TatB